ncbi:MAG: ABC transporter permease [Pseudomonadales bacterium]|nr:ABC transporter permease [Pseudomonadales bacterium]
MRQILRELVQYRDHIATAFWQDFRSMYRGTFFGVTWNVVLPLAPVLLYTLLAQRRVLPVFDGVNPSSYVALGATIWFLLASCVQQPLQIVQSRNAEVMKTALPLSAMVVSGFAQILFDALIRMMFVIGIIALTGTSVKLTLLWLPLVLVPAVLLSLGTGLILGIANLIYSDVGRVTGIFIQYGLFISGVIFPLSSLPFSEILKWNPFYFFIEEARVLSFQGVPENLPSLGIFTALAIAIFLLGCRVFYVMEYRVRGIA